MKIIYLHSKKYGTKECLVDDDKFQMLTQYKWHIIKGRNTFYAERRVPNGKNKYLRESMHRLVLGLKRGSRELVDHINGNGMDNQESNLRSCTQQQNIWNSGKTKGKNNSTSMYIGVSWGKRERKWIAQITVNGKNIYLGSFQNEEEAALCRDEASKKYFGKFARLNFPSGTSLSALIADSWCGSYI